MPVRAVRWSAGKNSLLTVSGEQQSVGGAGHATALRYRKRRQLRGEIRSAQSAQTVTGAELHIGAQYVSRQPIADILNNISRYDQARHVSLQHDQGQRKDPAIWLVITGPLAATVIQCMNIIAELALQKVERVGAADRQNAGSGQMAAPVRINFLTH